DTRRTPRIVDIPTAELSPSKRRNVSSSRNRAEARKKYVPTIVRRAKSAVGFDPFDTDIDDGLTVKLVSYGKTNVHPIRRPRSVMSIPSKHNADERHTPPRMSKIPTKARHQKHVQRVAKSADPELPHSSTEETDSALQTQQ